MKHYLRNFWRWLMSIDLAPGWVVVRQADHEALQARLAAFEAKAKASFEVRSNAQKKRAKPAAISTNGATQ